MAIEDIFFCCMRLIMSSHIFRGGELFTTEFTGEVDHIKDMYLKVIKEHICADPNYKELIDAVK